MDELLKVLAQLYNEDNNYYEYEGKRYFEDSELYSKVVELCDENLIRCGGCNWVNISILEDNDYRVFAGEKDSFGWLSGCVQKIGDRRIVVFG